MGTIPKGQITTKCHVNSLARIESVWVFNEGLISQIKSFPKIIQSRQSSLHLNLSLSVAVNSALGNLLSPDLNATAEFRKTMNLMRCNVYPVGNLGVSMTQGASASRQLINDACIFPHYKG